MSYENLLVDSKDRIATLTINRPKQLNALSRAVLEELDRAMSALETDAAVGAVILTGSGDKAFVAGSDIKEMAAFSPSEAHAYSLRGQAVLDRIDCMSKPVIAALNGFALGGGLELAMAAHMRVASEAAQLGQPEVNLGLLPGFGGTQRLPRLVGRGLALEILLTGERIGAAEALRIGLVNKVVPAGELVDACHNLASKILSRGPLAVRAVLEAVNRGLEGSLQEGQRLEAALFGLAFATADMREGTTAFLERREAKFAGK